MAGSWIAPVRRTAAAGPAWVPTHTVPHKHRAAGNQSFGAQPTPGPVVSNNNNTRKWKTLLSFPVLLPVMEAKRSVSGDEYKKKVYPGDITVSTQRCGCSLSSACSTTLEGPHTAARVRVRNPQLLVYILKLSR